MRTLSLLSFGLGTLAGVLLAGAARSQPAPSDEQRAAARVLGVDGVKLALAGDCANAVDKLTRAEALMHAPTTAVPLARCEIQLGHLVAGTERLNRLLHETLPLNPPGSWTQAMKQVQPLLDAAEPRLARLRVHVEAPASAQVAVTVDDASMPAALLDADRPTDPGEHLVKAKAPGFKETAVPLKLAEGEHRMVTLALEADPASATPPATQFTPATAVAVPVTPETPATTGGGTVPAFAVLGVGAAGLVVGSVFGALALATKSKLDGACTNKACPPSSQPDIDSLGTQATVSTIGFGVGIAGAALGVVLLRMSHPSEAPPPPTAGVRVTPWIGLGAGGLGGVFQ